nr:zinc finger, CCHC-type [Tanacetum cinerariifolium]
MSVVYVLTTPIPEDGGDEATVEQIKKRAKWDNDDYVCRELWDSLEAKYMAVDASNFKHILKHLKEEITLVEFGSHLRIEESFRMQDSDKPKGDNLAVVRLPDPKLKTLGERGIEYIFVRYVEHSKAFRFYVIEPNELVSINSITESRDAIFNENRFSLVHRPSLKILDETKDIGGLVVLEEVIEEGFKQKSWIYYFDTYAPVARINTIRLLIAIVSIHNLIIHQMDVKTAFLNGDLDEEVDLTKNFLSATSSIKDMGEADVILGIRIKHETNRIVISQSHYIKKVLKKFNYIDCSPVSTLMDTSILVILALSTVLEGYTDAIWISNIEENSSTSGWVFLLSGGAISWAFKKQTCITGSIMEFEFMALAADGKETKWLRNLILKIPLWSKPIAPIFIRCDSAATLEKAYSHMYNGKSRHLCGRHSMIRELITNGVDTAIILDNNESSSDYNGKYKTSSN